MTATLAPNDAKVEQAAHLRGDLTLPGDKSISHRALMLALLADGETRINGKRLIDHLERRTIDPGHTRR